MESADDKNRYPAGSLAIPWSVRTCAVRHIFWNVLEYLPIKWKKSAAYEKVWCNISSHRKLQRRWLIPKMFFFVATTPKGGMKWFCERRRTWKTFFDASWLWLVRKWNRCVWWIFVTYCLWKKSILFFAQTRVFQERNCKFLPSNVRNSNGKWHFSNIS